ncbi:CDP-2,3-bis-(O-geranylgeranyl)-sn-glycerol synthase [Candidatus Micrarchaeota archaeon]|nr:CDP-2,3-bis-(O-geranylgeranyl)-sn-glycerol synthase [Candidatus Micrarchaeota archaeon]
MNFYELLLFVLPAYIANAVPVVLGGGAKLDFNKNFIDGKRWLGDGKTIRGFASGILAGVITGLVLSLIAGNLFLPDLSFEQKIIVSFLLGLGAMLGDSFGSFMKRRFSIKPGESIFLLDQLSFVIFALALSSLYYVRLASEINSDLILFLLGFTYVVHLSANQFAHRIKLKKVPW